MTGESAGGAVTGECAGGAPFALVLAWFLNLAACEVTSHLLRLRELGARPSSRWPGAWKSLVSFSALRLAEALSAPACARPTRLPWRSSNFYKVESILLSWTIKLKRVEGTAIVLGGSVCLPHLEISGSP